MSTQTRLFILQKGVNYNHHVFRLNKGWKLRFACEPVMQMYKVRLFTNYPRGKASDYDHYSELKWKDDSNLVDGYSTVSEEINLVVAGSFQFFFTINGSDSVEAADGQGYLLIDPQLKVGKNQSLLPLDAIQLHTVLPKLLGPMDEWLGRLKVSYHAGYNMIHFTPLQRLNSESQSSYSIADQLDINPVFFPDAHISQEKKWKKIAELVKKLNDEWNMLSVTDMVYNHTANDSQWLMDNPECAYNLANSPHLKPAYLLDRLIFYTSLKVSSHALENSDGIPARITNQQHLDALHTYLHRTIKDLKLEEFYIVDFNNVKRDFSIALRESLQTIRQHAQNIPDQKEASISFKKDPQFGRLKTTIEVPKALKYFTRDIVEMIKGDMDDDAIVNSINERLRNILTELNNQRLADFENSMASAVNNVISGVRYRFVDVAGQNLHEVTEKTPLVEQYFINKLPSSSSVDMSDEEKVVADDSKCKYVMAHNGWVMNDDPMRDFARPGSNVYLRRELVVWGDSIKLRYGEKPSDSPKLWKRMEEYTIKTVEIFHGIRLDNCHSTPIHVAEHMMRLARSIRSDVYVFAELFTSHEDLDNIFVNRLGLNSLIREGLAAWDAHEQGRMVYKYGGSPVASFFQPKCQILKPSVAHALFMDATHDNESVVKKRSAEDSVSLAAFVAMASCATGSNRGYDELVPHHINVVSEKRYYQSWKEDNSGEASVGVCNYTTGIMAVKKQLNDIHNYMGIEGFDQVYVHDLSSDVVSITRHNPNNHQNVICVARSAFHLRGSYNPHCDALKFEGELEEVLLFARLKPESYDAANNFRRHALYINGLNSYITLSESHASIDKVPGIHYANPEDNKHEISLHEDFPPGSILVLKVSPPDHVTKCRDQIYKNIEGIHKYLSGSNQTTNNSTTLSDIMRKLTLADLHNILFNCEAEEKSNTGFGAYHIPNYGSLVYTGLQGIISPLSKISSENDLGHPLCQNLRDGDWLMDYSVDRLRKYPSLQKFADFVQRMFEPVKQLPRYLIPCYFDIVLMALSSLLDTAVLNKLKSNSNFIKNGSPLVSDLALCSQQFCGVVKHAQLAPVDECILKDFKHPVSDETELVSIAAGLPHFSEGIFRIWGRDTFIAIRGLLLATGRFADARAIILSFAGTLRHGLIPNLLGEGKKARYNCRDAVWWWLQAIQDYYKMAPDGQELLKLKVARLYPEDDCDPQYPCTQLQPLTDVMQEALQRHADGISFTERNAGPAIDEHMTEQGFNVEAGINWYNGFVYGGNASNCGTWMDKMGSSSKAGNKGKPATPRNGSAVELVGLCASTVRWLADLHGKSIYPYAGVLGKRPNWSCKQEISFTVWFDLIKRHFEPCFWIDGTYSSVENEPKPHLINKKHIYKDSFGAYPEWADYQLRPNFPVAIAVAPDLFTPENAFAALNLVEKHLVGPLGLKTLDPCDWNYNGDYHNDDDSDNYNLAAGFNYHQGPEWVWPYGYYLRARLVIAKRLEQQKPNLVETTMQKIQDKLSIHHLAICVSDWKSLPELTNSDGKECKDSCPAQAWSVSCLLDVLYDMYTMKTGKK